MPTGSSPRERSRKKSGNCSKAKRRPSRTYSAKKVLHAACPRRIWFTCSGRIDFNTGYVVSQCGGAMGHRALPNLDFMSNRFCYWLGCTEKNCCVFVQDGMAICIRPLLPVIGLPIGTQSTRLLEQ